MRESIPVCDDEKDNFNIDEENERMPRERWGERLVLGSDWLYNQDIKIEELGKQQRIIAQYLDTVDEVLFGGREGDLRGWASEQERVARMRRAGARVRYYLTRTLVCLPQRHLDPQAWWN
jgi:hypothetical protein